MTNQEILTKAIELAIKNGYKSIDVTNFDPTYFKIKTPTDGDIGWPWYLIRWTDSVTGQDVEVNVEHVLYDHDFAKALWGEGDERNRDYYSGLEDGWQYHLQMMVIADDPIKYLEESI